MFGFGFLNGLFLVAIGSVALPIIIHIINRRRLRRIRFSSLEFIEELNRRRMSKINLRRWIVLALRTLAVLMLVLAFARPTLQSAAAFFMAGEAPRHVVICLDRSASMRVERETGTAFTAAQALAAQIVDESGKNDLFNVVTFTTQSDVVFEAGTRNRQLVKSAIASLDATYEATAVKQAVETAVTLIAESELPSGQVYVVSDLRESSDSTLTGEIPENIRVTLVPVYREAVANVSIDRVFTPRKLVRPGEVVRIGVAVTNHSHEHSAEFPLELLIGDKRKAEQLVQLAPSSSTTATFAVSINEWGTYRCRIAKNRDRLPIDDDRYFLLDVSKEIPVTIVRGRKFAGDGVGEQASYFYLDKALNPRGSGEGEFRVRVVDENDLTVSSIDTRRVIVWTDPQNMDRRRLDLIKRFVHSGGSMIIFLGAEGRPFWKNDKFAAYLGVQRVATRERGEGEGLGSFQGAHPIFTLFNEEELELLSQSRLRLHAAAVGASPDSVLAYFTGGDPAAWECRRGKGRIIVFAFTPDLQSGDLPLSPMFLPFIHTSVSYLASIESADFRQENLVGQSVFFDLPPRSSAHATQLRVVADTGEQFKPTLYESPQGETKAMLARPEHMGFYRLLADTTTLAEIAVNLDPAESNLNARSRDTGKASLVEASGDFVDNLRRERQGREVYAMFLLLAMAALAVEAILGRTA